MNGQCRCGWLLMLIAIVAVVGCNRKKAGTAAGSPTTAKVGASVSDSASGGRKLNITVLNEVDTSFVEEDIPAITGRPLPAFPMGRGHSRVALTILAMSDDAATLAWLLSMQIDSNPRNRQTHLVINRKAGPMVDEVKTESVRVSGDGRHHAYVALINSGGAGAPPFHVIRDGVIGPAYEGVVTESLAFSPDGTQLVFVASKKDGSFYLVRDGKNVLTLPPTAAGPMMSSPIRFVFSPDTKHIAYGGTFPNAGATGGPRWGMWLDDKRIAGDEHQVLPTKAEFSGDSQHVAFCIVTQGDSLGYRMNIVRDGVIGPAYHKILVDSMKFSDDGKRLVYVAGSEVETDKNCFVVDDYAVGPTFEHVYPQSVALGGKHIAYGADMRVAAGLQPVQRLVVDDKPIAGIGRMPVFSADGTRLAYVGDPAPPPGGFAARGVVVDGKADAPLAGIKYLQFSPNAKHYAYVGNQMLDQWPQKLVIDGVAFEPFGDGIVDRMTLDDAGAVTAIVDTRGVWRRVLLK